MFDYSLHTGHCLVSVCCSWRLETVGEGNLPVGLCNRILGTVPQAGEDRTSLLCTNSVVAAGENPHPPDLFEIDDRYHLLQN